MVRTNNRLGISMRSHSAEDGAWLAGESKYTPQNNCNSSVVLDTGATHYIFCDRSAFTSLSPIRKSIQSVSGHHVAVFGVGSVKFRVFDLENKGLSKMVRFDDVWFVPGCTRNLVSGTQLLVNNFGMLSNQMGISVLSDSGSVIATVRTEAGLFCFKTAQHEHPLVANEFVGLCTESVVPMDNFRTKTSATSNIFATSKTRHPNFSSPVRNFHQSPADVTYEIPPRSSLPPHINGGPITSPKRNISSFNNSSAMMRCISKGKYSKPPSAQYRGLRPISMSSHTYKKRDSHSSNLTSQNLPGILYRMKILPSSNAITNFISAWGATRPD